MTLNETPKEARKSSDIGEDWNPVCCHGNIIDNLLLSTTPSRVLLPKFKHFCTIPELTCTLLDNFFVRYSRVMVNFVLYWLISLFAMLTHPELCTWTTQLMVNFFVRYSYCISFLSRGGVSYLSVFWLFGSRMVVFT